MARILTQPGAPVKTSAARPRPASGPASMRPRFPWRSGGRRSRDGKGHPERLGDDLPVIGGVLGPPEEGGGHLGNAQGAEITLFPPVAAPLPRDLKRPAQAPVEGEHPGRHFEEEGGDAFGHAVAPHLDPERPEELALPPEGCCERQDRHMGSGRGPGRPAAPARERGTAASPLIRQHQLQPAGRLALGLPARSRRSDPASAAARPPAASPPPRRSLQRDGPAPRPLPLPSAGRPERRVRRSSQSGRMASLAFCFPAGKRAGRNEIAPIVSRKDTYKTVFL